MNCNHCDKSLHSSNFSEQEQYQLLIDWLCEITCIPWVREHSGDSVPLCQQYGALEIVSSVPVSLPKKENAIFQSADSVDDDGDPLIKKCVIIEQREEITIALRIYNDSGAAKDCTQTDTQDVPYRSDWDVLKHIRSIHWTYTKYFKQIGMEFRFDDWVIDRERTEMDGQLCPTNTFMQFGMTVCTKTSYPSDSPLFHWCVFNCEGKPVCFKPEKNCED